MDRRWGRALAVDSRRSRRAFIILTHESPLFPVGNKAGLGAGSGGYVTMRDARQVFDDHWDAVLSGDMDRILADYAPDAVFVTPGAIARGHAEVQSVFEGIGENVGEMALSQDSVTAGDSMILLEWSGQGADGRAARGIDSFYVEGGFIRYQTLSYSVTES